eukprot:scaffold53143_cov23-Tisochrysis_lutea.AAC.1
MCLALCRLARRTVSDCGQLRPLGALEWIRPERKLAHSALRVQDLVAHMLEEQQYLVSVGAFEGRRARTEEFLRLVDHTLECRDVRPERRAHLLISLAHEEVAEALALLCAVRGKRLRTSEKGRRRRAKEVEPLWQLRKGVGGEEEKDADAIKVCEREEDVEEIGPERRIAEAFEDANGEEDSDGRARGSRVPKPHALPREQRAPTHRDGATVEVGARKVVGHLRKGSAGSVSRRVRRSRRRGLHPSPLCPIPWDCMSPADTNARKRILPRVRASPNASPSLPCQGHTKLRSFDRLLTAPPLTAAVAHVAAAAATTAGANTAASAPAASAGA